jgi:SAM-dependent methyltransferase
MFDFVRKSILWDSWTSKVEAEYGPHPLFHLKSIQDLAVYLQLRGIEGKDIAEVGGGNSRLLTKLAKTNRCANVEKFEGIAGGPGKERIIPDVKNIHAYLGDNDPLLADNSFDALFSVSVVEHVPTAALNAFHNDQLRVLRTGGIFIHAIDVYLEDDVTPNVLERFDIYKSWVNGDERVESLGAIFAGPCRFTCDLATNPDNVMFMWSSVAPELAPLRQRAQSVSILLGGRKRS